MENIAVKDLKQSLIDTIAKIDKEKLTIFDLKTLAETISVVSSIREEQTDYMDTIYKMVSSGRFGRGTTVYDLKGEK